MKSNQWMFIAIAMLLGALGVGVRILASEYLNRGLFPWGTFTVNVVGSLLIGILFSWQAKAEPSLFLMALSVGFLGALTTFSSFSMDSMKMFMSGQPGLGFIYIGATNLVCLLFCYLGFVGQKWIS